MEKIKIIRNVEYKYEIFGITEKRADEMLEQIDNIKEKQDNNYDIINKCLNKVAKTEIERYFLMYCVGLSVV